MVVSLLCFKMDGGVEEKILKIQKLLRFLASLSLSWARVETRRDESHPNTSY
jgi:hypothetical protein